MERSNLEAVLSDVCQAWLRLSLCGGRRPGVGGSATPPVGSLARCAFCVDVDVDIALRRVVDDDELDTKNQMTFTVVSGLALKSYSSARPYSGFLAL